MEDESTLELKPGECNQDTYWCIDYSRRRCPHACEHAITRDIERAYNERQHDNPNQTDINTQDTSYSCFPAWEAQIKANQLKSNLKARNI